jgi:hypothetical protein
MKIAGNLITAAALLALAGVSGCGEDNEKLSNIPQTGNLGTSEAARPPSNQKDYYKQAQGAMQGASSKGGGYQKALEGKK